MIFFFFRNPLRFSRKRFTENTSHAGALRSETAKSMLAKVFVVASPLLAGTPFQTEVINGENTTSYLLVVFFLF